MVLKVQIEVLLLLVLPRIYMCVYMYISGTQQQRDMVTYSLAGLNSGPLWYQTVAIPQIKPNGRGHSKAFTCSCMSSNLGPLWYQTTKGFHWANTVAAWIYIFELKRGRALQSMWTLLLSVCWKGIVSLWAFSFECELAHCLGSQILTKTSLREAMHPSASLQLQTSLSLSLSLFVLLTFFNLEFSLSFDWKIV
jgi:hypothetical protein